MDGLRSLGRSGRAGRLARFALFALTMVFGAAAFLAEWPAAQGRPVALQLTLDGAVSPASADYLVRGIEDAAERGAGLVILRMDTPGGLDASMRSIIAAILASPVPVATHVAPSGARAASAGTYIMMASHVAAMAPSTSVGAATPVALGGGMPFGGGDESAPPEDGDEDGEPPAMPRDAGAAKAVNDAVAYIRGLAELRGRNADWAERAVREAATLTSSGALDEGVIDFIAATSEDLLEAADGLDVEVGGASLTLQTAGMTIETADPDWRTRLLGFVTNPNIAMLLMVIGFYGIVFELINPGALVPGTVGGISLLTGLYALAVLPVNIAGAGLLLLGAALVIAEAFAPSFGILGIGGAAAIALGAAMLFDTAVPGIEISWPFILALAVASLGFSLLVARLAVVSHRSRAVTGQEEMVGAEAKVLEWNGSSGYVFVHGERWQARSEGPQPAIAPGAPVRVTELDGLTLIVAAENAAGR
ncbi:nodulation protein NfeD [soil metagenome]